MIELRLQQTLATFYYFRAVCVFISINCFVERYSFHGYSVSFVNLKESDMATKARGKEINIQKKTLKTIQKCIKNDNYYMYFVFRPQNCKCNWCKLDRKILDLNKIVIITLLLRLYVKGRNNYVDK